MNKQNKMVFERFGRSRHLRIESYADLEHVVSLDEAHWVATGAPILSINSDSAFLDYLDIDDNRRIMCFEVKRAITWLLETLNYHSGISEKSDELVLGSVNGDTEDGAKIITAANNILLELQKSDDQSITLKQVRDIKFKLKDSPVAGIATSVATSDPVIKEFIVDMINTVGGIPECSEDIKHRGVSSEKMDEFLKEAVACIERHNETEIPKGKRNTELMPLGNNTHNAYQVYLNLRDKIDQYFAQCEAITFDQRVSEYINQPLDRLNHESTGDMSILNKFIKDSPLAVFHGQRQVLLFSKQINPYYLSMLQRFHADVMMPLLGQSIKNLSKYDWLKIKDAFTVYEEWYNAKKGSKVEKLGIDKLRTYLDENLKKEVMLIIANSNKTALILDNINLVEKGILYQSNIIDFVNNFVSFPHLYDPKSRAMFEMGTLIIDGRHLNFSVKVDNRKAHSAIAKTSDIFILYVEVTMEKNNGKYTVAVPVTSGTKGNLCIGKRGIFCDLHGKLLEAKVVEIIENPISVGETILAPFQRLGKLFTGKIEAMTTSAEKKLDVAANTATITSEHQTKPANNGLMAGGLLLGGGVAFAAVTSAVTFFVKTIGNLGIIKTVGGIIIAIVAVIAPASLIALLKLRRRDLSSILEGVGWAINVRMRLTFKQGRVFTEVPPLPGNACIRRSAHWFLYVLLIITILMSIVISSFSEEQEWRRNIALGLNLTRGNSDTSLYNIDVNAERKGTAHEFILNGKIAYGDNEDETTEENANATAQYNYICIDKTYLYFNTDYLYDNIARIDYRITIGPGIGYYFINKPNNIFSIELGVSYIDEKLDITNSVDTGSIDEKDHFVNLRIVGRYDYKISETAKLWNTIEYLPEINDFDLYLINYELGLESVLNSRFTLRFVLEDKYDSSPAVGIKENDVIIKSAVVCNL